MYIAGLIPAPVRQVSAVAFAGLKPQDATPTVFESFAVDGVITYVDPNDHAVSALTQGGMYDFGATPTKILEIRALTALGNISAIIADKSDLKTVDFTVGGATPAIDFGALGVVAGDKITVTSGAATPLTEVYTVASVVSATVVKTTEMVTDRDLIALDVITIASAGGTSKYTHTLAGANTLDLDVATTHNTPIGTPATSRLVFEVPPVLTPAQVLLVSTVSASALGWVDVYAVKGDVY